MALATSCRYYPLKPKPLHSNRVITNHLIGNKKQSEDEEDDDFDENDPEDVARHERLMAASQNKSINEESGNAIKHKDR